MLRPMARSRGREIVVARARQAVANRRVFSYLALVTVLLGILAGVLVTVIDHKDFPTVGTGIWWAIVTLGTVGYGDVVPHSPWGRVIGGVVITFGVTFLAMLTAIVTSAFISAEEQDARLQELERTEAVEAEVRYLLQDVSRRLERIEARLPSGPGER
jgi:voltage-gated potassium channel